MKLWFGLGAQDDALRNLGAPGDQVSLKRVPIIRPTPDPADLPPPPNPGTLIKGSAKASEYPGDWPRFRGANRDNIARTKRGLARSWPEDGPKELWRIPVAEGYAGAAIRQGRVYMIDYDKDKQEDAIRCLSLDTGEEIWRYTYSVIIRINHGMTRTVPTLYDRYLIAIGPKCHVHCLDALTGELIWKKDMVAENETVIPKWYTGQCPLVDKGRLFLAPAGKPIMMAVDMASGDVLWEGKAEGMDGMTESSILPFDFQGKRQYVYCTEAGIVSFAAEDGALLWTFPGWKIRGANVPTPLAIGEDRIFFCGGYGAGSLMLRLVAEGGKIQPQEDFRLEDKVFGSEQQTPILFKNHLYGVEPRPQAEMVCLDLEGNRLWSSGMDFRFELGSYMLCDDLLLILEGNTGLLRLAEISPEGFKELTKAQVVSSHEAWGPMAMAEGRLVLRDFFEMVCIDIGK